MVLNVFSGLFISLQFGEGCEHAHGEADMRSITDKEPGYKVSKIQNERER